VVDAERDQGHKYTLYKYKQEILRDGPDEYKPAEITVASE
jgi:hypothetical protein